MVVTKTVRPAKPTMFPAWSSRENMCWPRSVSRSCCGAGKTFWVRSLNGPSSKAGSGKSSCKMTEIGQHCPFLLLEMILKQQTEMQMSLMKA